MEKLMPIVPGCRAVVIAGEAAGESCLVKKWLNPGERVFGYMENDTGEGGWLVDFENEYCGLFREQSLMRIDGGEFEAEMFQESLEDLEWVLSEAERLKKQISSEKQR